jgi:ribosomal protein S12 methylthiotransferase accessory factor
MVVPATSLQHFVDDRFGPLFRFQVQKLRGPEPEWWLATASIARSPIGSWFSAFPAAAAGTSIRYLEATERCLGEGVERYAALNSMETLKTQRGPSSQSIIERFPKCHESESCWPSFKSIAPIDEITQSCITRLDNGEDIWVPAGYVHLGFFPDGTEKPVTMPISTGLAFSQDRTSAIWRGLCEAAERDAIMLSWLTNSPKTLLSFSPDATGISCADIEHRLLRLKSKDIRTTLLDITVDFVTPVVLCILESARFPYFTVGAACNEDPARVCAKAIDEAVSVRFAVRPLPLDPRCMADFRFIDNLHAHASLYASWPASEAVRHFTSSAKGERPLAEFLRSHYPNPPEDFAALQQLAKGLTERGLTILWADLTPNDLVDFGHVIRVLVPEYMPLSQRYDARWLATPRLHSFLQSAGMTLANTNRYPHPFA